MNRIRDSAYRPRPGLEGGHRMTLYAWARPRRFPSLPSPLPRFFDVAPGTRVLAHCHWQPERRACTTLVLLHGLEGSSEAHYMRGVADKARAQDMNVVLLNQRNCGGTEHLSPGLYHSGLIDDPLAVIRELLAVDRLPSIAVAGYSLGGNLALKLAGDLGAGRPPALRTVCAVSPTMDLARCVNALERPENALYQWNFVRNLKARMRRKARMFPHLYRLDGLGRIRTVREFDERFTAPHHGFHDADDYYHRASALRVTAHISIPTLIVSAADDPFVPPDQFEHTNVAGNPSITRLVTPHGGHCAFVSATQPGFDGYWAEQCIVDWIGQHAALVA